MDPLKSTASKIFAGVYALFAGVVFLPTLSACSFAPWVHRLLHRFHIQESDETSSSRSIRDRVTAAHERMSSRSEARIFGGIRDSRNQKASLSRAWRNDDIPVLLILDAAKAPQTHRDIVWEAVSTFCRGA